MPPKTARQLDRFSQFGLVAGRLALDDARLTPGADGAASPERIGIYLGSALGGIAYAEEQHERYLEKGIRQVAPNLALAVFGGAAPANLGIALDVRGPILSTANSCASGAVALGEALGDLREGRVDAAIAGGCEIPLSPLAFGAFDIIRALSAGPQRRAGRGRPAVRRRPRRVRHGRGRGAARPRGGGGGRAPRRDARTPSCSATARPPTRTTWSSRGPTAARRRAPRRSRSTTPASTPTTIDYVNAHASSTPIGDVAEARAIATALGERAATVPVSGTKALYGHPLGASGAIEAAICALAIRDGWAPASVNLDEPDPGLGGAPAGPAARGPGRDLPARAVHLVRVRRPERGARVRAPSTEPAALGRSAISTAARAERVRGRDRARDGWRGDARSRRCATRRSAPTPTASDSTPPTAIAHRDPDDRRERAHRDARRSASTREKTVV